MYYEWKNFDDDDEDRPEKPRRHGVTEVRGPQYTMLSHNMLQDIFESMGQFVDGMTFFGGSCSLMCGSTIKELIDLAHYHDVYVSTGEWGKHLLQKGYSSFIDHVEHCKRLGFDMIELNASQLGAQEETLLRYVRVIKNGGMAVRPHFSIKFNKSDLHMGQKAQNRAFWAYVPPANPSTEFVEDVDLVIRSAERCLKAGADMIMINADDISRDIDSLRTDLVAKIVGRIGLEKTMFESSDNDVSEWFIRRYGPKVNLFVDLSQVIRIESLRGRNICKRYGFNLDIPLL